MLSEPKKSSRPEPRPDGTALPKTVRNSCLEKKKKNGGERPEERPRLRKKTATRQAVKKEKDMASALKDDYQKSEAKRSPRPWFVRKRKNLRRGCQRFKMREGIKSSTRNGVIECNWRATCQQCNVLLAAAARLQRLTRRGSRGWRGFRLPKQRVPQKADVRTSSDLKKHPQVEYSTNTIKLGSCHSISPKAREKGLPDL